MPLPLTSVVARTALSISARARRYLREHGVREPNRRRAPREPGRAAGCGPDLVETLKRYEAKHYSQNGEDGVLECLFRLFGVTNKFYVEFGAGSGEECNTRWLREHGWSGVLMDCDHEDPSLPLYKEFVTAENVTQLLAKYGVPLAFDLLSIDIDGNDYWVWKAIGAVYRPRVAVVEFNCAVPAVPLDVSATMPYDPMFRWTGQPNAGQSLLALKRLGERMGYALVYADPPNAFLVLRSMLPADHEDVFVSKAWRAQHSGLYRWQRELWKNGLKRHPWIYP